MALNFKSVNWWHQQFADWLFLNPDKTVADAATVFGTSPSYLYLIKNSDAFKAYWDRRRRERDSAVSGTSDVIIAGKLPEKLAAVAEMALDQIMTQLDTSAKIPSGPGKMDGSDLRATADLALKKLGYGIPSTQPSTVINNTNMQMTANAELLAAARQKMLQVAGVAVELPNPQPQLELVSEEMDITDGTDVPGYSRQLEQS